MIVVRRSVASRAGYAIAAVEGSVIPLFPVFRRHAFEGIANSAVSIFCLLLCSFPLWVLWRILTSRVEVSADRVRVVNVFSTTDVGRDLVTKVVAPNSSGAAMAAKLCLLDGRSVSMFAVSRMKNRAWGDDKGTLRGMAELAELLDVPVVNLDGPGSRAKWG